MPEGERSAVPTRWRVAAAAAYLMAVALAWPHRAPLLLAVELPCVVGFTQSFRRTSSAMPWLVGVALGSVAFWRFSEGAGDVTAAGALACSVIALWAMWTARESVRRWLVPLAIAFFVVAYLSSGHGGAGPMLSWFQAQGLSLARAQEATLAIRKTIHFTFYGTVGWLGWRAFRDCGEKGVRASALGLGIAFVLAGFDELRQSGIVSRTGTGWDVLLDLAGATTVIGLSAWRGRNPR